MYAADRLPHGAKRNEKLSTPVVTGTSRVATEADYRKFFLLRIEMTLNWLGLMEVSGDFLRLLEISWDLVNC